jgi:hypothetical protein
MGGPPRRYLIWLAEAEALCAALHREATTAHEQALAARCTKQLRALGRTRLARADGAKAFHFTPEADTAELVARAVHAVRGHQTEYRENGGDA